MSYGSQRDLAPLCCAWPKDNDVTCLCGEI